MEGNRNFTIRIQMEYNSIANDTNSNLPYILKYVCYSKYSKSVKAI